MIKDAKIITFHHVSRVNTPLFELFSLPDKGVWRLISLQKWLPVFMRTVSSWKLGD